jgi:HEAT repeat protein
MLDKSSSQPNLGEAMEKLRSADVLTQNEGVQELIQIGPPAVPELLSLVGDEGADQRAQTMYALSEIGAPEAAEAFKQGLHDKDERVRAYASVGLSRIGDSDSLEAAIQTINDAPNQMHLDLTPSVFALGGMGLSAVTALLDLMMNDDENTRLHAQRALEMIVGRQHGFEIGHGFPTPDAEQQALAQWQANGNFDYAAPAEARGAAVEKWRDWLRKKQ